MNTFKKMVLVKKMAIQELVYQIFDISQKFNK